MALIYKVLFSSISTFETPPVLARFNVQPGILHVCLPRVLPVAVFGHILHDHAFFPDKPY
jgi:hypothetical protein